MDNLTRERVNGIEKKAEMVIDNFAGGGGASTGIELAIGRPVDVAINHDIASIQMHRQNHPHTKHYCEDVWEVDPLEVTQGRPVALCWFSPDCKHFSKAKGGKPREKKIRGLAWVAVKWAATVKPRVIILENVEEFQTWGPLDKYGYPIKALSGRTFKSFVNALKNQGYDVDYRELRACDYGAPTIRKRFFLVARRDGEPIRFPQPTHGAGLKSYRTAAEIIDFSLDTKSIFGRKKPLAENTLRRIARGLDKFVLKNQKPFIVSENGVKLPYLTQYHTETAEGEVRGQTVDTPIQTIDTQPRYGLAIANLCVLRNNMDGKPLNAPLSTVTTSPGHFALQTNYLVEYYSNGRALSIEKPLHTMTTKERNGLISVKIAKIDSNIDLQNWPEVRALLNQYCGYSISGDEVMIITVGNTDYFIADIGFRMLTPRELYNGQGFPSDYCIDFDVDGKSYSKKEQVARCGNSVPPVFAEALVRANLPELCGKKYETMQQLHDDIAV